MTLCRNFLDAHQFLLPLAGFTALGVCTDCVCKQQDAMVMHLLFVILYLFNVI